jgi:Protein of unknown function (DUF3618)
MTQSTSKTSDIKELKDSKDPRQIEARLDETRNAIGEDIKALGQKISPENLKHEAKVVLSDVKDSAKEALVSVKDSAKSAVVDAADSAKQTLVEAAVTTKDTVVEAAGTAKEALVEAKDVVSEKVQEYKDVAVETFDEVSVSARRAGTATWTFAKQNALPLSLIGIGGAWLIAGASSRSSAPRRLPTARVRSATPAYTNEYDSAPRGRIATYGAAGRDYTTREQEARERDYPRARRNGHQASSEVGSSVAEVADKAKHAVADVSARAHDLYDQAGDKVSDASALVSERAQDLVGRAGQALKRGTSQGRQLAVAGYVRVRDSSRELAQENPLALGAAALAVGIGIGLMLPSTSKENQLLGATRDRWIDEARDAAQGVRTAAHTLGETVKETVDTVI